MNKALFTLRLAVNTQRTGSDFAAFTVDRDYLNSLSAFFSAVHTGNYKQAGILLSALAQSQGICITLYSNQVSRIVHYSLRDGRNTIYEQGNISKKELAAVTWLDELDRILTSIECANYDLAQKQLTVLEQLHPSE